MYIELFIVDNFVMDMLIIKTASALCGVKANVLCSCIVCFVLAVVSALCVVYTHLSGIVTKIIMCIVCASPFYVGRKEKTLFPVICVLVSTFLFGGIAYSFAEIKSDAAFLPAWSRVFLYPAFIGVFLPQTIRRIRRSRMQSEYKVTIKIKHKGIEKTVCGIIDSGNTLCEPLSGLPVIIMYADEYKDFADMEMYYSDTHGMSRIYGFIPQKAEINGKNYDVCVGLAENDMTAAVPAFTFMEVNNAIYKGGLQ